jgi:formaldehyde-activating enzyme involved in methanogenesis
VGGEQSNISKVVYDDTRLAIMSRGSAESHSITILNRVHPERAFSICKVYKYSYLARRYLYVQLHMSSGVFGSSDRKRATNAILTTIFESCHLPLIGAEAELNGKRETGKIKRSGQSRGQL